MEFILTIVLFVAGLIFRKSKFIAFALFVLMWTLWGWNTWNGDYDVYASNYQNITFAGYEIGYKTLYNIGNILGLSFQEFLIVYSFIVLGIIAYIVFRYVPWPAFAAAIYLLIFFQEFVYLRYALANSLAVLAIYAGITHQNKKSWYIGVVLLAVTIHYAALIYLMFIPAFRNGALSLRKSAKYLITAALAVLVVMNFSSSFFNTYILYKLSHYAVEEHTITNSAILLLFIIIMVIVVYSKVFKSKTVEIPYKHKLAVNVIYNINILSLLLIVVFAYVPYYANRFLRYLFIIDMIFFIIAVFYAAKGVQRRYAVISLIGLILIIGLFLSISTVEYTVIPLYKCNLIWGNEFYIPELV